MKQFDYYLEAVHQAPERMEKWELYELNYVIKHQANIEKQLGDLKRILHKHNAVVDLVDEYHIKFRLSNSKIRAFVNDLYEFFKELPPEHYDNVYIRDIEFLIENNYSRSGYKFRIVTGVKRFFYYSYSEAVHQPQEKTKKFIAVVNGYWKDKALKLLRESGATILKTYRKGTIIFYKIPESKIPEAATFESHDIYNMNWSDFSENHSLPEDFIRDFKDFVNWVDVSMYSPMSEKFIIEMKDKVFWHNIMQYQKLSPAFKKKYAHLEEEEGAREY